MSTARVWRVRNQSQYPHVGYIALDGSPSTLDEISSQLPCGAYTTFRTFGHNKSLPLEAQFHRLEESANLMKHPISLNREEIRNALRQVVELYPEPEMRIRLTLDLKDQPGAVYISVEPLITPRPKDYENGVITVTHYVERNNPKAKHTYFLSYADKLRQNILNKANEVLLVNNQGQILEGLSSNFFAVKQGEIWTDEKQVLSGIVRSIVLEEARAAGFWIQLSAVHITEIETLEEAFLTSASRSVLPIQKIDENLIRTGKPGPITMKIIELYHQYIQRHLTYI